MRKFVACLVAVPLVATGCKDGKTLDATQVTNNSAVLRAGATPDNGPMTWYYEYGPVTACEVTGNGCTKTPVEQYPGPASTEFKEDSTRVEGLQPRIRYRFRACGNDQGQPAVCGSWREFVTNWNSGNLQPLAGDLTRDSNEATDGGPALDSDGTDDGDAAALADGANGLRRYPFTGDPSGRNGGFLVTGPFRHAVNHIYKQQNPSNPHFGQYVAERIAGGGSGAPPIGVSTTPARDRGFFSPHQAVGLQNGGVLITDNHFIDRVHYVTPPSQGRLVVTIAGSGVNCPNVRFSEQQDPVCRDTPGAPPLEGALQGVEGVAPLKGPDGKTGTPSGGPGDFLIAANNGLFKVSGLDYSYDSGLNKVTVSGGRLTLMAGSGMDDKGFVNDDPNGYPALQHDRDLAHVSPLPGGDYVFLTGCRLKWLKNSTETIAGKTYNAGRIYPFAGEGAGPAANSGGFGGCRDSIGVLPQDGDGGPATSAGIDARVYFDVDYQGGVYLPNFTRRVRYIHPLDPATGTRTIVTVAGIGYGETVEKSKALGPGPAAPGEPELPGHPLLGFHSGITLFNEHGFSGVLFSDMFDETSQARIMFMTLKDRPDGSASPLVVQPFPVIP